MKLIIRLSVMLITILLFHNAMATENITGTWQGKLVVAPGAELTIQFIISQDADGSYAVILNSPDEGGIKDVKANSVSYDSGNLKLEVAELSGAYEGVVKDEEIEGTWKQEGTSMPLILTPYTKPALSKEDKEKLLGEWNGKLKTPAGELAIVFRFEMKDDGDLSGYMDVPDQNATGIPVSDIEKSDGNVILEVSSIRTEITGKLTDNEIVGEFKQGPKPLPLTLKKGKYVPPAGEFNLSKEDINLLLGEWHGAFVTPDNTVMVVVRFEMTEDGQFNGFADSPDQGGHDIPITSVEMSGADIVVKVSGLRSEFKGTLSGNEIVGELKQGPTPLPLTLKKGKYRAPVRSLNLPKEAMELLSGKWSGKLGPLTLVFRFETSETGDFVAFVDIPNQKAKGIPVTEANFGEGELSLTVKGIRAEFKGQLSGNEIVGEWTQGGRSNPLSLTKE